ncbi:hypothetical protein CEXT_61511 [Caerostris extrusa]|uniref:Uncharacterized protein n=1 Tax=Caerostris extrusa TaxID=172846 RepID=A0AAV4RH27_CAEEX|nr:hypothetical protein CEXT_61511 [Caerostris extrusa]
MLWWATRGRFYERLLHWTSSDINSFVQLPVKTIKNSDTLTVIPSHDLTFILLVPSIMDVDAKQGMLDITRGF